MKTKIEFRAALLATIASVGALMILADVASGQALYESDYGSGTVNEFSPDGMRTFATGVSGPNGLALDSLGNLYVANSSGGTITVVAPDGTEKTIASGLDSPWGVAVNRAGDVFVSSQFGNTITKITPNGEQSTFVSGLNEPYDLVFDKAGNLFEADWGSGRIYEFINLRRGLSIVPKVFASGLGRPTGMVFDSAGNLFVANGGVIGSVTEIMGGREKRIYATDLEDPLGLAFDDSGNLLVASGYDPGQRGDGNSITEIAKNGRWKSIFASGLNQPTGLVFRPLPEHSGWVVAPTGKGAVLTACRRKG
jgi:hypothetical protein